MTTAAAVEPAPSARGLDRQEGEVTIRIDQEEIRNGATFDFSDFGFPGFSLRARRGTRTPCLERLAFPEVFNEATGR